MCGILGRFSWDGPVDPEDALPALVNHLAHRGPDDATFWRNEVFFLGHRRLSIIDLAGGSQPMSDAAGSFVITFNGEIYNYHELRETLERQGYAFTTQSDTEVLLHGYSAWGVDLPRRLVGMFAFAIADRRRRELFLARDPFGEKPLLYLETPGSVTFASEMRPLAALPECSRRLDEAALGDYLCLNYVPGDRTLMSGIARLAPGSWRRYSAARIESGSYWTPPAPSERALDLESALTELRQHVDRAVRLALVSDVPVGIFLSGGMDSSLIAESALRQGRLARAYCLDFPEQGYSEYPKAQRVAERLGLPLTRVEFSSEALGRFSEIVEHADDPLADSSALPVWTVSRAAAREGKVVLGGDGGDELFGGYLTYQATLWHAAVAERLPAPMRRLAAAVSGWLPTSEGKVSRSYQLMRFLRAAALPAGQAHFSWNGTWLPEEAARLAASERTRQASRAALASAAHRHGLDRSTDLASLQRADIGDYLANDILAKVDRMSMAHGLEVRAPFLQPAVCEFALSLPAWLRCGRGGKPKRLLRELARRVYGPEIADAPKQGFSIPVHAWLRGPGRALVADVLSPAEVRRVDALDAAAVARAVDDHLSGRRSLGWELWGLMVLVRWHAARIRRVPERPSGSRPVERVLPGAPEAACDTASGLRTR